MHLPSSIDTGPWWARCRPVYWTFPRPSSGWRSGKARPCTGAWWRWTRIQRICRPSPATATPIRPCLRGTKRCSSKVPYFRKGGRRQKVNGRGGRCYVLGGRIVVNRHAIPPATMVTHNGILRPIFSRITTLIIIDGISTTPAQRRSKRRLRTNMVWILRFSRTTTILLDLT